MSFDDLPNKLQEKVLENENISVKSSLLNLGENRSTGWATSYATRTSSAASKRIKSRVARVTSKFDDQSKTKKSMEGTGDKTKFSRQVTIDEESNA